MSLTEDVMHYSFEMHYNCAESMVLAACPNIHPDVVKAVGAFGGGMGCGKTCGALTGAIAVLGIKNIENREGTTPGIREKTAQLVSEFEARLGSTQCVELKKTYFVRKTGCVELMKISSRLLEEYI